MIIPSVPLLQQKCSHQFTREGLGTPAFPGQYCNLMWPNASLIDVILFGDGLDAVMASAHWPSRSKFRLWTLSQAMRQFLVTSLNLRPQQVRVIPRYLLFPMTERPKAFVKSPEAFDIVYSGRTSRDKAFFILFEVARELQRQRKNSPPAFKICHPAFSPGSHELQAASLENWPQRPQWLGDLGTDWIDGHPWHNPVLFQLSISSKEDFGVSVAQAQAAGFPLVLSDWGAHRDIRGANVIKIPPRWIIERRHSQIAMHILIEMERWQETGAGAPPVATSITRLAPEPVSHLDLQKARKYFPQQFKTCYQEKWLNFKAFSGEI